MANLTLNFYLNNTLVLSTSVIGAKMSNAERRKWYGPDDNGVRYYVKKRNEYGIKWVCKEESFRFGTFWGISTYGPSTKSIPVYNRMSVIVH